MMAFILNVETFLFNNYIFHNYKRSGYGRDGPSSWIYSLPMQPDLSSQNVLLRFRYALTVFYRTLCDKVCQWRAAIGWFSPVKIYFQDIENI